MTTEQCVGILFALLPAIGAACIAYLIAKHQFQKPQEDSILAKQLTRVFSPIQKILFFSDGSVDYSLEALDEISKIIDENFYLIPTPVIEQYYKVTQSISSLSSNKDIFITEMQTFQTCVNGFFKAAQINLGCSRISSSQNRKELASYQKMLSSSPFQLKYLIPFLLAIFLIGFGFAWILFTIF